MTPGGVDKGNTGGKGDKGRKGGKDDYDKGGKGGKEDYSKDGKGIDIEDLLFPNLNDVCRNDFEIIMLRYDMCEQKRRRLFGEPPTDPEHVEHDVDKIYAWYDRCLKRHRRTPTIEEAVTTSSASSSSSSSPSKGPRTSKGGKGDKAECDGKGMDGKGKKSKRGGPY
jgi:hypothetical protein